MGFILRLREEGSHAPLLVGRVPSARDALALMRRWREQYVGTWVEVVQPERRPSGDAA
jgi:hypothetical protein